MGDWLCDRGVAPGRITYLPSHEGELGARASARRQLRHAVQLLQQLGAPLAGVVLTRAGNAGEDWGGSYRWQRRARAASSVPRNAAANE